MVEFYRLPPKDDFTAFPYGNMVWVNYYPSYGIIVHFSSHTVHVLGRNLASVYEGLRDQTLDRVHMRRDLDEEATEPVVTNIYIRQATKNAPGFERLDEAALRSDDA